MSNETKYIGTVRSKDRITRHVPPQLESNRLWMFTLDLTSWARCLRVFGRNTAIRADALVAGIVPQNRYQRQLFDSVHWLTSPPWRYAPVFLRIFLLPPWMIDRNLETAGLGGFASHLQDRMEHHAPPLPEMPLPPSLRGYKHAGSLGKKTVVKTSSPINIFSQWGSEKKLGRLSLSSLGYLQDIARLSEVAARIPLECSTIDVYGEFDND